MPFTADITESVKTAEAGMIAEHSDKKKTADHDICDSLQIFF